MSKGSKISTFKRNYCVSFIFAVIILSDDAVNLGFVKYFSNLLTGPFISESCIKIKINLNFYFHTSLWCLKKFYEGL